MARGSCLCGAVAYEVTLPFDVIHNCHCGRCRKARAAAHTTNGFVRVEAFRFTHGADAVRTFPLPGARRFAQAFCTTCGSAMPRVSVDRGVVVVPLATLDDDPGAGPQDHIHVGSKAEWFTIADALPQFERGPR
ncbi:MAG: GFA family protein [Ectothiorhodospiraceae bacterium]|nr:GFA family protein [Chromatiales bacterium]MCP5154872.1 GFA family protein [Ectothiorhodospiraceae bacterium]